MTKAAVKSEKDAYYAKYFAENGIKKKSILTVDQLKNYGAEEVKASDLIKLKCKGWLPFVENADHDVIVALEINHETVAGCVVQSPDHCVFAEQFKKMPGIKHVLVLNTRTYLMYSDGRQVKYVNPSKMSAAIREFDKTSSVAYFKSGDYTLRAPNENEKTGTGKRHSLTKERELVVVHPNGDKKLQTFAATAGHRQAFEVAQKIYPESEGYKVVKSHLKSPRGEFIFWYKGRPYRKDPRVSALQIDNPANANSIHAAAEAKAREELSEELNAKRFSRVEVVPRRIHSR